MDQPGITAAVVQKGFQVFRVGARIRLSLVHGVRVIGGVLDLIGLLTPHNAQRAFLRHALPLSPGQHVQWVIRMSFASVWLNFATLLGFHCMRTVRAHM